MIKPTKQFVLRDSFARFTRYRSRLYNPVSTCSWCGGVALFRGKRCLYQFSNVPDSGRGTVASRLFCSNSCYESYYG